MRIKHGRFEKACALHDISSKDGGSVYKSRWILLNTELQHSLEISASK